MANTAEQKIIGGLFRVKLMLVDYIIINAVITIVVILPTCIGCMVLENPLAFASSSNSLYFSISLVLVIFSIYLNKDVIKGKSPAKRIYGFVVIDNKTGEIANPIRTVLRNITLIILPIELVFAFFSPERRIGDYIAGTRMIVDDNSLIAKLKVGQIMVSLIIGIVFMLIIALVQL